MQLDSHQLSLCLLATSAYQAANFPTHERYLQRLRLKTAYLLAMQEGEGPLGKHSMLGSSLGTELRRLAKADMEEFTGAKSKLAMLADDCLLLEPHGTTSAMRLDVDALEKVALQAVVKTVGVHLQLPLTSQHCTLNAPGSSTSPVPHSRDGHQPATPNTHTAWPPASQHSPNGTLPYPTSRSHHSHHALSLTSPPGSSAGGENITPWAEAMATAILAVWWPHQPLMAGLALAIIGQPANIARMRGGSDMAKLAFCTKELSRLAGATHRYLPPGTKPREVIANDPLMRIRDDVESWEVVQIDCQTLAELVINEVMANGNSSGPAMAVHKAVWPPSATHTLPIGSLHTQCQPLARHVMHLLSCTDGPQARDALLARAGTQLMSIVSNPPPPLHASAHPGSVSSFGDGYGNDAGSSKPSPGARIPLYRILQQAAQVYGQADSVGLLRCAAAARLASLVHAGPLGPMSMSAEDLGRELAADEPDAWEQLPVPPAVAASPVSKVRSVLEQVPGFLVMVLPTFPTDDGSGTASSSGGTMTHYVQLDPAMLQDAAVKATGGTAAPAAARGQAAASSNGSARHVANGAAGVRDARPTALPPGAPSPERIKQWAAAVFAGSDSQQVLCRVMAGVLADSHENGHFTASATTVGTALARLAPEAYQTQRTANPKGKMSLQGLIAVSPVFIRRPKLPSDLWISLNLDELQVRAAGRSGARKQEPPPPKHPHAAAPGAGQHRSDSEHGSVTWAGVASRPSAEPAPLASFDMQDPGQLRWVADQLYPAGELYRELKLHAVHALASQGQWHKWNKPQTGPFPGTYFLMGPQFGSAMKAQPGWQDIASPKLVKLLADDPYMTSFPHCGNAMVQLDVQALVRAARNKGINPADYRPAGGQPATAAASGAPRQVPVAQAAGQGTAGGQGPATSLSPLHPKSLRSKADSVYPVDTPHRAMKIFAVYTLAACPGYQLAGPLLGQSMAKAFKAVWEALPSPKLKNLVNDDPYLQLTTIPHNIGVALNVVALLAAADSSGGAAAVGGSSRDGNAAGGEVHSQSATGQNRATGVYDVDESEPYLGQGVQGMAPPSAAWVPSTSVAPPSVYSQDPGGPERSGIMGGAGGDMGQYEAAAPVSEASRLFPDTLDSRYSSWTPVQPQQQQQQPVWAQQMQQQYDPYQQQHMMPRDVPPDMRYNHHQLGPSGLMNQPPPGFSGLQMGSNSAHLPQVQVVHVQQQQHVRSVTSTTSTHVMHMSMGNPAPGFNDQPVHQGSRALLGMPFAAHHQLLHGGMVTPCRSDSESELLGEDAEARVRLILEVSEDLASCDEGDGGEDGSGGLKARLHAVPPEPAGGGDGAAAAAAAAGAAGADTEAADDGDLLDLLLG